jgi:predicted anti-sigma-YlaC factor YlaD
MNCGRFKRSIEDYLEDRLDGDERRAFREHMKSCSECRDAALILDPSLLAVASVPTETDEGAVTECVDAVTAMIRQERLRRRLAPRFGRWAAAAALCVVALGGGFLWRVAPWQTEIPDGADAAAILGQTGTTVPPPRLEVEMPHSEVTVYQYAGSDSETTAVYFIVNQKMEL